MKWFRPGTEQKIGDIRLTSDRDTVVFYGMLALFILFLLVAGFDALVFYKNVVKERGEGIADKTELISAGEFEDTIQLLDKRSDKFNALAGEFNLPAATSTKVIR